MSWNDHEETAHSCGGHLASITSNAETIQLVNNYGSGFFIGGHRPESCNAISPSNCWEYSDGTEWWSNWDINEYNKSVDDDRCAVIWSEGLWHDVPCSISCKAIYIFDDNVVMDPTCLVLFNDVRSIYFYYTD